MGASDDRQRVHFQSPAYLVDRLDAMADLLGTDRTELLVEAIREYVESTADSEAFRERVAASYYEDKLDVKTVKQLVGPEQAQRLRLLKADLESDPFELAAPEEERDIYSGDAVEADETTTDQR
ncbi:ribbon-helix-helix protein, CopG family [Halapricum desulfuricans]|uniref:RHH-fold DNA-binding protein n=1 Tax=Halapricum desulfuricans TaxID=2841257 RepID=A0A897MWY8_9EURY|nr:ribbon-helix-helix protein, CopG family [Halapricum desulfuricans]QSG04498.1 RHH-fold DNA-binding protein [Halapricum desulfuricans]